MMTNEIHRGLISNKGYFGDIYISGWGICYFQYLQVMTNPS